MRENRDRATVSKRHIVETKKQRRQIDRQAGRHMDRQRRMKAGNCWGKENKDIQSERERQRSTRQDQEKAKERQTHT